MADVRDSAAYTHENRTKSNYRRKKRENIGATAAHTIALHCTNTMTEVTNWYRRKNIFVTGATGFLGKCLVEKLLRDCADIGDVYIMIRDKANAPFEQRKNAYVHQLVFSKLTSERPAALGKIKIVQGNLDEVNFGLDESVRRDICDRVSVVFHVAADVRFDRELSDAYRVNVIGTKNMLDFALGIKQLKVFVHVSTAYSQEPDVMLEERAYRPPFTYQQMEEYRTILDADMLNSLSHK